MLLDDDGPMRLVATLEFQKLDETLLGLSHCAARIVSLLERNETPMRLLILSVAGSMLLVSAGYFVRSVVRRDDDVRG